MPDDDLAAVRSRLVAARLTTFFGERDAVKRADLIAAQLLQALDDAEALLAAYDVQAARLTAVEQALQWAVTTLDGYRASGISTEHWIDGWAAWLEQQARPALAGAAGEGRGGG